MVYDKSQNFWSKKGVISTSLRGEIYRPILHWLRIGYWTGVVDFSP